jgi:hypothetical protein
VPPPDPGAATVVGDLLDQQDRLDAAIEAASRADLTVRLASPASKFLRFRLGDVLLLLSRHQLRHLGQARRALGSTLSNE